MLARPSWWKLVAAVPDKRVLMAAGKAGADGGHGEAIPSSNSTG